MQTSPYCVAHRGLSASFPENTLRAFAEALAIGVDWIELDVVLSADDVVIVTHDTMADRCTNGSGAFRTQTWDRIRQLDAGAWFRPEFAGERIPTLHEVIDLVHPTATRLCIEIKGDSPNEFLATARATVSLLKERDFVQQSSVASFNSDCLRAVRAWEPTLTTNFDPAPQDGSLSAWALCQQCLRAGANFMSHTYTTLTPEVTHEARLHGLPVWAWTVNDTDAISRMAAMGVDAILSDDTALLNRVLAR